jgi:short subunit dehydrogenase-like uncharacterized protein
MADWLIYGANGYTGKLLVEEAVKRGHRPVLAGRSAAKVAEVAARHGLESHGVDLGQTDRLRALLHGKALVVHAAGPFVETSAPMVEACIAEGVSYLDITGELEVFAQVFGRDGAARIAGIALLPGVGFDVVPTDCLARHVAERVPGATHLEIAIAALSSLSTGTAKSMLRGAGAGGFVRRDGRLVAHPFGRGVRSVRFSDRARTVVPIPWGDLETAYRTTRIPNITTFAAVPSSAGHGLQLAWPLLWASQPLSRLVLGTEAFQSRATKWVERRFPGPDASARAAGKSWIWARASDGRGAEAQAWLETLEGYTFTAIAAIRAVERVLADKPTGALTPALAFGKDFVLDVEGTRRLDALP